MTLLSLSSIIILTLCLTGAKQESRNDNLIQFAGTTPCNNIIRPLHNIKNEADCELKECQCFMVEWQLWLYRNPVTHEPTNYKLTSINRFTVKETNMYSQPGTKTESTGNWIISKGTNTNPAAIVYRLNPDNPAVSLSLIKLSDNLLHVVDTQGKLLIGNEFFSYTLNRIVTPNK